ncbi:hypothetical protein K435DRAFT_784817 [Dendrothele bispora CBS 962.96]|uniref:Uncharacterized protein n=1 Tax=Dendrothele bispora (strain CBS 962.96) TaxID=1314807 RepID=A0A4S8L0N1_DENBC|nr:hypothetical protein K435DRAFT_784817 [Dendrothele bispora CBS 962.96]
MNSEGTYPGLNLSLLFQNETNSGEIYHALPSLRMLILPQPEISLNNLKNHGTFIKTLATS